MPLPGMTFLKTTAGSSSSAKPPTAPPARPPSPLSAANAKSTSTRPSTTASGSSTRQRASASRGPPSISSASSVSGVSLSSRTLAAQAEQEPTPPLSQSSRSLSSRLLRRRPSEKSSLARTPRLPALDSAASESESQIEPLTGSTTGTDVFAEQQDMWGAQPLMSVEERRMSEAERAAERVRRPSERGSGEAGPWGGDRESENPWLRRSSAASQSPEAEMIGAASPFIVSSESPFYLKTGYTALPPPPRPGARRYTRIEVEDGAAGEVQEAGDGFQPPQNLAWRLWGRRASDPVKYAAYIASRPEIDFPKDHPFAPWNKDTTPVSAGMPARSESDDRDSVLASERHSSRFGDAPPMPSTPSFDGSLSPTKRSLPKSPRYNKRADGTLAPPPRSSSRLGDTTSPFLMPASPSLSSSLSDKDSLHSNTLVSRVITGQSSQHAVHALPLAGTTASPLAPLQYQLVSCSPKSSSAHFDSSVISPTRPARSAMRPSDPHSASVDDASADSDGDVISARPIRAGTEAYEVSVACVQAADVANGVVKWEVTVRPSAGGRAARANTAPPDRLSGAAPTVTIAPAGATHIKLSLAIDKPDGSLSFVTPILPPSSVDHSSSTRRRRSNLDNIAGFSIRGPKGVKEPWGVHARGETFGMANVLSEDAEIPLAPPLPISTVEENNLDRRRSVTPPPRMSTPPPMPSNPFVTTTPTSSSRRRAPHSRSSSETRSWALSPGNTTPTPAASSGARTPPRAHTPRELTYVSSPSPRSTPRRTRIVSASQLNGGLFAHGTVDGMSEEAEGYSV